MSTPDLKTLTNRMQADVDHYIPGAELRPRFNVFNVITKVYAAAIHALYQYAWNLIRNILPSTCDDAWVPAWASVMRVPRGSEVAAKGTIQFAGAGAIPQGTIVQDENGNQYLTAVEAVPNSNIQIAASVAGKAANSAVSTMTLLTPIQGISNEIAVISPPQGGQDIESIPDWRNRIIDVFADRQKVGDQDDYERWIRQADPSIRYPWVYPNTPHLGDVTIVCSMSEADPIPSDNQLSDLDAAFSRVRNVTGHFFLLAPIPKAIDVSINGVDEADQASITQSINQLFSSLRTKNATFYASDLHGAIRQVYSGTYTLLQPTVDTVADDRELLMLGNISW